MLSTRPSLYKCPARTHRAHMPLSAPQPLTCIDTSPSTHYDITSPPTYIDKSLHIRFLNIVTLLKHLYIRSKPFRMILRSRKPRYLFFFFLMIRPPPSSPLFPYTTLSR